MGGARESLESPTSLPSATRSFFYAEYFANLVPMIRITPQIFPLVLALLLNGCATDSEKAAPPPAKVIKLHGDEKIVQERVRVSTSVTVTLPPAQAGLAWQISYTDTRYLPQTSEFRASTSAQEGPSISFLTRRSGRTRVLFVLVPTADRRTADPVDQLELILTIE